MLIPSVVVGLAALVLLLPTFSDLLSLARTLVRRRPAGAAAPYQLPRLLFLVPAHNEELLIASCVRSLVEQEYPDAKRTVVVLCDNCSDRTAPLARAAGAQCLERQDPAAPGKPHAIAWALGVLELHEYDAVVIVDADTVVAPTFARALAERAPLEWKAVQGYCDVGNRAESALTRMAAVFAAARYHFGFPLKQRAGLNTPLMGNGMCLGTQVLATHGWKAFSLCEDWEMYTILTERGVPIDDAPMARVYAQEARSLRQSSTQRQRWTAGKLVVLAQHARAILGSERMSMHQRLDLLAELSAPGPAVHAGIVVLLVAVCLLLAPPLAYVLALLSALSLVRPIGYTVAALCVEPEPARAIAAFLFLPFYTIWRLGIQLSALSMLGNRPWVRTERHARPEA